MDRPIKFRVWDGDQMLSPDWIDRDGFAHWKTNSIPNSSNKLMQFTGLLDRKGKEIYEGDIVQSSYFLPSEVKFDVGCFMAEDVPLGDTAPYPDNAWEIIGNIWEQPDLLKEHK